MPAKSKQQQKFFGVVRAMQKGDIPKKGEAGEVADDMKQKDVKKMASTKHKGLPKKVKEIIVQELVKELKLNEVKPFVDPKLKSKPNDPVQYVATNDHRYPSELAFFDTKKNEVVFFNIQRKDVERVSVDKLNSTHWVRDYLPGLKYNQGLRTGAMEGKLTEAAPRMRIDPDSEQLMSILKDVSRMENKMKSKDRSRYSHVKGDFKKFFDSLMNLKSILDRQGPTIPEGKLTEAPGMDGKPGTSIMVGRDRYVKMAGNDLWVNKMTNKTIKSNAFAKILQKAIHDKQVVKVEGKLNEALPKFKTPYEAFSWIMDKREEAMDIEMEMLQKTKDIIQTQKDMEQEASPEGGPTTDRYGAVLEKLQMEHEALRKQFAAVMAEIDEYDQNYM